MAARADPCIPRTIFLVDGVAVLAPGRSGRYPGALAFRGLGLALVGLSLFSPFCSVVGGLGPLGEVNRQATSFERFVDCAAPGHLRCSDWPCIVDPSRQEPAGRPVHLHARDVTHPAKQSAVVVGVEGLDAQAFAQRRIADPVLDDLAHGDAAHLSDTPVEENS